MVCIFSVNPHYAQRSNKSDDIPFLVGPEEVEDFIIDFSNIRIAEEIGRGAFGVVHRGIVPNLDPNELRTEVAVKLCKGKGWKAFIEARVDYLWGMYSSKQMNSERRHPHGMTCSTPPQQLLW